MSEEHATPEHSDSLGQRFRIARVSQGMTLEQMAAITRIREDVLRAMEEDRFDRLPQLVFARGFARSYARALNLDEEHWTRLFEECFEAFYKDSEERPLVFPKFQVEGARKGKTGLYVVVILVGVLLLVLLRVSPPSSDSLNPTINQQRPASSDRAGGGSESASMGEANERPDTRSRPASATETTGTVAQTSSPPESVVVERSTTVRTAGAEDAPLVLELRALAEAWVVVHADDGELQEVLLREGEHAQWRAYDRFLLTLGNAGAVEVTFNGQPQGPFGDRGVVVRDIELRP